MEAMGLLSNEFVLDAVVFTIRPGDRQILERRGQNPTLLQAQEFSQACHIRLKFLRFYFRLETASRFMARSRVR